jgi:3-oxoacyl-[acyl-carrier protein] reductase
VTLAVVTGASRGIGRATALLLSERDVNLVLVGRESPALADTGALASRKVEVTTLVCDLADRDAVARTAERLSAHGVPDVIVNAAGVVTRASVEETSPESWDHQLDVNLRAPFMLVRALLPGMRARGSGRVVNVGSISSTLGSPRAAAYAASKWGLVGFTKSLAEELRDSGVVTLAVLPGSVDTDMLAGSGFSPRMSAGDVAKTLVHYALDAPDAHNGAVIEMFGV